MKYRALNFFRQLGLMLLVIWAVVSLVTLLIELVPMIDGENIDEVNVVRRDGLDFGRDGTKIGEQFGVTECR